MPRWTRTLNLKDLLGPDGSDDEVKRTATVMAARLQRELDLSEVVDELREIADDDGSTYNARWTRCRHFNDVMDEIYNWADAERVWIA